ncbi:Putative ParB-like nuclease [Austwickia chelonae]|uniref:ParB-like nuclease n=1 Tax=Austwickia chelonae NBRC 105200 TaxID=1184607 RepID=K6UND6_9MICO|nr:ParB/Srx family N-terminal domain-containing protein [Austwickia chelonae]GAB78891.1 hypothetical protein AUCHE_17_01030 [Austwickia chelonae NBRC 105200]SEV85996.1 Putative ParB-like nuclease [Austwickia chelonae]
MVERSRRSRGAVIGAVGVFAVAATATAVVLNLPDGSAGGSSGGSAVYADEMAAHCRQADGGGASGPACARAGAIVDVRLADLRPTQPALGHDAVLYRLGRYDLGKDKVNKKYVDWCQASGLSGAVSASSSASLTDPKSFTCELRPGEETDDSRRKMKTVVIGPQGRPYLVDGHHTISAFRELPDGGPDLKVRLRVVGNLSGVSEQDFWERMRSRKWAWLTDQEGRAIAPAQLPAGLSLAELKDDAYRSLVYFTRDVGYTTKEVPFQEFYWGAWLRSSGTVDPRQLTTRDPATYLEAVRAAAQAQVSLSKKDVVHDGMTAKQLGRRSSLGEKALDKLGRPLDDPKPGKVAYLFAGRGLQAKR